MKTQTRRSLSLATAVLCLAGRLQGDSVTEAFVSTGAGALQERLLFLDPPLTQSPLGRLVFEIGFATAEAPAPGQLFDSFSVSLELPDGTEFTPLVTVDAFGLTIEPPAPGLPSAGEPPIMATPIASGIIDPPGTVIRFGYSLELTLPPLLRGQPLLADLAFFDNGDSRISAARFQVPSVPEPAEPALLILGVVLLISLRRRA